MKHSMILTKEESLNLYIVLSEAERDSVNFVRKHGKDLGLELLKAEATRQHLTRKLKEFLKNTINIEIREL